MEPMHLIQQLLNSLIILDSLYCGFQVRNEALMEPMVAFVQLDVYLQPLSTLISGHTRDLRDGETVTLQCISKEIVGTQLYLFKMKK